MRAGQFDGCPPEVNDKPNATGQTKNIAGGGTTQGEDGVLLEAKDYHANQAGYKPIPGVVSEKSQKEVR